MIMKTTSQGEPVTRKRPSSSRPVENTVANSNSAEARPNEHAVATRGRRAGEDPTRLKNRESLESIGLVLVVLPAYNEGENLPSLLSKIETVFANNGRDYQVIVVDEASGGWGHIMVDQIFLSNRPAIARQAVRFLSYTIQMIYVVQTSLSLGRVEPKRGEGQSGWQKLNDPDVRKNPLRP